MLYHRLLYTFVLVGLLALGACEDLLDQEPVSEITQSNAFESAEDAEAAIIGTYNRLQDALGSDNDDLGIDNGFVVWGDLRADALVSSPSAPPGIEEATMNALTSTNIYADWSPFYGVINAANTVLENVLTLEDISPDVQNRILGEAYFLRAYSYFYLVRIWGDVPLVETAYSSADQEFALPRTGKADIFALIESDLAEAAQVLPPQYTDNAQTRGRATLGATQALQAHVFTWIARREGGGDAYLQQADAAATAVINSPVYALAANYADIFGAENTSESIFELQYNLGNQETNDLSILFLKAPYNVQLRSLIEFDPKFIALAETRPEDTRIPVIKQEPAEGDLIQDPFVVKYAGKGQDAQGFSTSDDNIPLLRLGGILLLQAEIKNQLGDTEAAVALVNQIRERAGLSAVTAASPQEATDLILEEGYVELFAEGHRWFDLIRHGVAVSQLEDVTSEDQLLWPLNIDELTQNPNLVQNSFY